MSGSIVAVAGRGLKLKTFQRVGRLNSQSVKRGRQCLIAMQRARHTNMNVRTRILQYKIEIWKITATTTTIKSLFVAVSLDGPTR